MQANRNLPNDIYNVVTKTQFNFDDLIKILKFLRSEKGCPWDRSQSHESIEINLIEEAYELADAIEKNSQEKMLEETGDVLLQSLFHAVIAEEKNEYTISDAINAECIKLITRHSHIFGEDNKAKSEQEALKIWEKNKYTEKNLQSASERVSDLPKNFPSLLLAEKTQKRAGRFNYKKNKETIKSDIINNISMLETTENKEEISGKILFDIVSLLNEYSIESEICLKKATDKFIKNFCKVDEAVSKDNKNISELDEKSLKGYYNEVTKC